MSQHTCSWKPFCLTLCLVLTAACGHPTSRSYLGDLWRHHSYLNQIEVASAEAHSLNSQLEDLQEVAAVNNTLQGEVIAGNMKLADAVEMKWERNQHRPDWVWIIDQYHTGGNREEKMAFHFVHLAVNHERDPQRQEELAERLYEELCETMAEVEAHHEH